MTCHLNLAADPYHIEESQYGTGPWVQFSAVTSCILIAGQTDDGSVCGTHLVMVQPDGEPFRSTDAAVVTAVLAQLNVQPPSLIMFGQTGMWSDNIQVAYDHLRETLGLPPTTGLNDGVYGAKMGENGVVYFEVE